MFGETWNKKLRRPAFAKATAGRQENKKISAMHIFLIFYFFIFLAIPAQALTPNDTQLDEQWYLEQISAYDAWDQTTGSSTVVVAILDSGMDMNHPDLYGNLWTNPSEIADNGIDDDGNGYVDDVHGWDFIDNDNDPEPNLFQAYTTDAVVHGTLVAGLIGAVGNNNSGIAGVNWDVQIMPIRILDGLGSGTSDDAAAAVDYAVANGAKVINSSFSGFLIDPQYRQAIREAYNAGVAVVAAVGNNDTYDNGNLDITPIYPACYERFDGQDWVIGVAATDANDEKTDFSNYGSCVDISAPGSDVYGTQYRDNTDIDLADYYSGGWDGTSVAAPQVTGAIALLLSKYPTLSVDNLQTVLQLSVDPVAIGTAYAGKMGAGRLNIAQAFEIAPSFATASSTENSSLSLVVAPHSELGPEVRRYNLYTEQLNSYDAYASNFMGGVRVAMGDVDGDGIEEIVTGAGPGGGPQVQVLELDGTVIGSFFAYEEYSHAGIYVATGDTNGNGIEEIIVSSENDSQGRVRIFNYVGERQRTLWLASYAGRSIRVAAGDVDGDGVDEIITGLGPGYGPSVRVLEADGSGSVSFEAYASTYDKGIYASAGDIDGDGIDEIITGTDEGGGPHVRAFDRLGNVELSFFAYAENFRGGVHLGVGDLTGDGVDEIVTAAGPGGSPHLRVFSQDQVIAQWYAFDQAFSGGINIAAW